MKRFLIVLRYELREYFSSKVFMVLTAVLALRSEEHTSELQSQR